MYNCVHRVGHPFWKLYLHTYSNSGWMYIYICIIYIYTHHHIPSKLSHSTCHFGVFPISGHFHRTEMNWEIQQIGEIVPGVAMPVRISSMMSPSTCMARGFPTLQWTHSTLAVVGEGEFPLKMAYFQGLCYQRIISTSWWNSHALFCRSKPRSFWWQNASRTILHSVYIIYTRLLTNIIKYLYNSVYIVYHVQKKNGDP